MKKRITIKEIAEIAGVNISTVSRVLNPESGGRISKEQREKIIAICDKLNYRPRVAAKGCAQNKTFKIGLILGAIERDLCNSSFALYIRGVCSILQKHGYNLAILWVGETQYTQAEEVKNFLMSDTADGYILGAPLLEEQTLDHNHYIGDRADRTAFLDVWAQCLGGERQSRRQGHRAHAGGSLRHDYGDHGFL